MKPEIGTSRISRRILLSTGAAIAALPGLRIANVAQAEELPERPPVQGRLPAGAPLASWNDGPAKQAILDFVRATTDQASPKMVPPEQRIATFDQDGTLWVEHPMYTQVIYCLDRVPAVVKAKPELEGSSRSRPCCPETMRRLRSFRCKDLEEICPATLTGMTVEEFQAEVKKWLATAKDPRWKRPYTELTYQPMQEVLTYFRANGYKTYIVTGGGQDFVRVVRGAASTAFRPSKWSGPRARRSSATARTESRS